MESQTKQRMMPPGIVLYQIGIGHYFSRALALAAKLGVADLLKTGRVSTAISLRLPRRTRRR
jgi:hypothetical protein